ncbi:MAG: PAS domain S-box protein [Desulfovibrionaceae bacterium]|nr:PAS domain S-box protein [Desulfovibrionaceae bacterium]
MTPRAFAQMLRLVLAASLLLAWAAAPAPAAPPAKKQILLLNSYHQNFSWNEEIFRGLSDVLRPRETGITLHVEYMDTKRVEFNEPYRQRLKNMFGHKYKGMKLDLIMVTDNNAFEFMRRNHGTLFPLVPVVFCGVNNYRDELIRDHPLFTGVAESVDAATTLWLALRFHPDTSSIYIVNDFTPTGRAIALSIREQLASFSPTIPIRFNKNLDMDRILAEVERLPKDALILYGVFNRDAIGRYYDMGEVTAAVAQHAKVPVYGLFDLDIDHGIVGGVLSSGYWQGQSVAQMALHVLSGRHPQDVPVIRDGLFRPMFDYRALKRFGISLNKLPENSEILNRPKSFYAEHSGYTWLGAGFAAIQTMIIVALIFNITRRRQAEKNLRRAQRNLEERVRERTKELRDSEEALRTVFDSSHDAIFIHDVHGEILEVNQRMLDMFGLEKEEVLDQSLEGDFSSRDNAMYRLSAIWRDVVNGEPQHFDWRARRPRSGEEFDTEVYLTRITFRGREAILANVRDISVRKESENRIRRSLTKFEAIFENSLMGIAMSVGRKIVTINRRGAEIFGYSPQELLDNSLSLLLGHYQTEDDFVRASKEALYERGEFNTEQAFRSKNGSTVWCRMYAKAVDSTTLDKGVIWAWDDVTENRRAREDLLRAREDAEAANHAKSEFLAAMSHEIRTPMNAIVGMTDITLQTDLSDDQRDYLRTVQDSARHLLSIINDILDLSKIEARKLELDHSDFDLPFHVQTTIKGLDLQARQKGLELALSIDETITRCIRGDSLSLRQVLVNLVGNAIKFTHRGRIEVRLTPAPPDTVPEDAVDGAVGVTFEVEDSGIGIPKEFLESIFQSFSQTTRAFGGTGLGLAICKQLISLMGGDIEVKSVVGKGSVFSFTVWFEPGVSCPVPVTGEHSLAEGPPRPVRVLVAEDNDVNVMVTTLKLEEMGYTYSVAGTGLEVLNLLKREPFDIILMDIEMPVLDGISTTKAIRSAVPGGPIPNPAIPIIGVTAHALKEFREKSLDAGMDDYVSKPVDFRELSVIVNRLIGTMPLPSVRTGADMAPDASDGDAGGDMERSPWTPNEAMERLGVDRATFADFMVTARGEMGFMSDELSQAIGSGDLATAASLAHTLRSVCTSIGANAAARAAAVLERACRENSLPDKALEAFRGEKIRLMKIMDAEAGET